MQQPHSNDPFIVPAKKSLGQHFLTSDIVPGWLCEAADLHPDRPVLEIGPGTGVLTAVLLEREVSVLAIETDKRSLSVLRERFASHIHSGQLQLIDGDVRDGIPNHPLLCDHSYQVVANIPYYLTGLILRTYLESERQPAKMTLLVQKEVAERIARDKKQSILQVAVHAFGTPEYVRTVRRGHFTPPPRIESAILTIHHITHERVPQTLRNTFFSLVRAGFAHRRKQLLGNIRPVFPANTDLESIFSKHGLSSQTRAENLTLDDWITLSHTLTTLVE